MRRIRRRAGYYLLFISVLILVASVAYDFGMKAFEPGTYPPEGTELSLLHSMQVVVETFTATGYGSDSPWRSPQMNLLVMLLDVTGVGLFFLALPAVLLPLFQEALRPSAPTDIDRDLVDHVVICTYTERSETVIGELEAADVEYVLVEPDEDEATRLHQEGYTVVYGDPEDGETLRAARLERSRALVADVSDKVDASIVLAAKEVAEDVDVVSVVENPELTRYHRLAGADRVVTPRRLLGESLAAKVTTDVDTDLDGTVEIGEDVELVEYPVGRGTNLAGRRLADSRLRERFGVNVVGAWVQGEFTAPVSPDARLEPGTVLLVVGDSEGLERFRSETASTVRRFGAGRTIVVGHGEVGGTVAGTLEDAGVSHTVVDMEDGEGVDVVGDATDPETLRAADVGAAQSVVLALPDDTVTEFATLVARDIDRTVEIIARAQQTRSVPKAYRAGADYVLSLSTVSGRSIAAQILDAEDIVSPTTNVEVVRTTAPGLVGETLASGGVRERTGCTVVGIESDGEMLVDVPADHRIDAEDTLVVVGTDEGTNKFVELFC